MPDNALPDVGCQDDTVSPGFPPGRPPTYFVSLSHLLSVSPCAVEVLEFGITPSQL